MTSLFVDWEGSRIKLTWCRSTELPDERKITSVHGLCFFDNRFMLVRLRHRGWDIPGGHMEGCETPEECLHREVFEEAYVKGVCSLLGYVEVSHEENINWNPSSKYPMIGYQAYYRVDVTGLLRFEGQYESTDRIFIQPDQIKDYWKSWNIVTQSAIQTAVEMTST